MSRLIKKWQQLHPSDQLLLIVRAAQLTSDTRLFNRLLRLLDESIACVLPKVDQAEIIARLKSCKGTTLEPFTLSEKNLQLASRLAQFTFSKRHAQSCFRVISEQSVGNRGGMLLSADGKDHYVERFMRKDDSFDYRECWYWAPSSPLPMQLLDMAIYAEIETTVKTCEQAAFLIEVEVKSVQSTTDPGVSKVTSPVKLLGWEHGVFEASVVNGKATIPLDLLVALQSDSDGKSAVSTSRLVIKPGSPELIMRFSALLASCSVLQIDSRWGGAGKAQLKIQLALPEAGPTRLTTDIRRTNALFEKVFQVSHDIPLPLDGMDLASVFSELSLKNLPILKERKAA
jgi:hypothetical protein